LHVHPLTPRDAPHQHVQQEDPTQNNTEEVEPFEIEFEEEHEQQQDTDNDEQQQQVSNNNEQQQQDYNDDQLEEEHEQQQDTDNDEQEQQVSDNNEQQQQDYNDDQHQESDYTLENDPEESDTEKQPVYHDAFEFRSYGDESPTIVSQLCSLLFHLNIIDALKFKIKRIPQPGRQEFRATVEIYNGSQCCYSIPRSQHLVSEPGCTLGSYRTALHVATVTVADCRCHLQRAAHAAAVSASSSVSSRSRPPPASSTPR
jgi:hypothetical protein